MKMDKIPVEAVEDTHLPLPRHDVVACPEEKEPCVVVAVDTLAKDTCEPWEEEGVRNLLAVVEGGLEEEHHDDSVGVDDKATGVVAADAAMLTLNPVRRVVVEGGEAEKDVLG